MSKAMDNNENDYYNILGEKGERLNTVQAVLEKYDETYLVLDGRMQSVLNSTVNDECQLYNLKSNNQNKVIDIFNRITGKLITDKHNIEELSGGQRLILTAIIGLESPAQSIIFVDYFLALHDSKKKVLKELINSYKNNKNIQLVEFKE